jgi:hypothetical protein
MQADSTTARPQRQLAECLEPLQSRRERVFAFMTKYSVPPPMMGLDRVIFGTPLGIPAFRDTRTAAAPAVGPVSRRAP